MEDITRTNDAARAGHNQAGGVLDNAGEAHGHFHFKCFDGDGNLKWEDDLENTVMTLGKDALLTNALKGSAYTAAVYVGLISSISYVSAPVAGDTMAAHGTWTEAGAVNAPTFAARVAATFGAAAAGALATSARPEPVPSKVR
jgi:hypothetical protein